MIHLTKNLPYKILKRQTPQQIQLNMKMREKWKLREGGVRWGRNVV